ncbi:Inter-alpha-trypsin inhibitor heavy chain H5-like protein [Heterocephalus glaber]|uniref:Inter-alpha-trypsin inhibitor heavy chain H5-like protein n=1 Tax=Heterocephalus glaber TaxID=10181 RepID=G5B6A7_HETGA|nr:Inter-alpha-trypsin inhibitor heavy chain H5-like protein [Heterocephalus glaber]
MGMWTLPKNRTEKAMNVILSDLQASDYFHIIYFSDTVNAWKSEGHDAEYPQCWRTTWVVLGHRVSFFSVAFGDDANFPLLGHLSLEIPGSPHWDGDSEEMLRGPGDRMESHGSSVRLAKGSLPNIFTFSSSEMHLLLLHFVIHIPHSGRICFTLDGHPEDLLQLIEDPKTGQFQHTDIQLMTGPTGPGLRRHHRPDMSVVLGKRLLKDPPRRLPLLGFLLAREALPSRQVKFCQGSTGHEYQQFLYHCYGELPQFEAVGKAHDQQYCQWKGLLNGGQVSATPTAQTLTSLKLYGWGRHKCGWSLRGRQASCPPFRLRPST